MSDAAARAGIRAMLASGAGFAALSDADLAALAAGALAEHHRRLLASTQDGLPSQLLGVSAPGIRGEGGAGARSTRWVEHVVTKAPLAAGRIALRASWRSLGTLGHGITVEATEVMRLLFSRPGCQKTGAELGALSRSERPDVCSCVTSWVGSPCARCGVTRGEV